MFARLNANPMIELSVFHGKDVPGTKLINSKEFVGFDHKEMLTLSGKVKSSGRSAPWVCCPFVWLSLFRHRPDVIVVEGASNIFTNIFVFAYAKLFRKPIVWWTLGVLRGRKYSGIGKIYRRLVVAMEKNAAALLGYSSAALSYFERTGYSKERFFRAVNVVDTDRVKSDINESTERVAILRKKLGLDNAKVILFVGALTFEKKIHRLIHSFANVSQRFPDARLVVVGDGSARKQLESLCDEVGCSDRSTFSGQVIGQISDYYELGTVFVLPGLGGLAISEAMTHGLPIICSRGDGCEVDLVRNGDTGFRIDSDDDDTITQFIEDKLAELLNDDQARQKMSDSARSVIKDEHNVNTYIANIVDAIVYARTKVRSTPYPNVIVDEETS